MKIYPSLTAMIEGAGKTLLNTGKFIKTDKWQAQANPPEMWEALFVGLQAPMLSGSADWKHEVKPNLPWADDHFAERVSGIPSNPGEQYKNWPYYPHGKDEGIKQEVFSHTYQERFWPKIANRPVLKSNPKVIRPEDMSHGIRYRLADLSDLIYHLRKDPHSRQAYLPIFFPEDTGAVQSQRVPCTLGYHFILRGGYLHITYYIRSCDFLRHFRDDVYMALLLADHILHKLSSDQKWNRVQLGMFRMDIISLHVFANEYYLISKQYSDDRNKETDK